MDAFKLRPLGDRLVARREKAVEKSEGGIHLPEQAQEKPQKGEVVAVGNGKLLDNGHRQPLGVVVGDTVIFGQYAGQSLPGLGDEIIMLREQDIFGIVE